MSGLSPLRFSPGDLAVLRGKLLDLAPVTPILAEPELGPLLAALGMKQETGTVNDELAGFIFDADTGRSIPRERFQAELVSYHGTIGVRIWAEGHGRLDLRVKGLRALLHPTFSINPDGSVGQCVLFPASIAKIAALQGTELVLVREWGLNTIFGGFDPAKPFYETNMWELVHNDTLRYSGLLEHRQVAFLGSHDLTSHIAGITAVAWDELRLLGQKTKHTLERYFAQMKKPSVYSLVLPYAAGVLLDDLAQPMNYGAPGRKLVFTQLMEAIEARKVRPDAPRLLLKFPESYEKLIVAARSLPLDELTETAPRLLANLIDELNRFSVGTGHAPKRAGLTNPHPWAYAQQA